MSCLKVNDTFTSYEALREALSRFEDENRVQFWKRDAKKIRSAEHYAPLIYNTAKNYPELEYYYLKFCCIHGGQVFRPYTASTRKHRKHRGTWKQDCKAEISISLTKDRSALIINSIVNEHNHEIPSVEEYNQLPKQRKKFLGETTQKKQQLKTSKHKKRSETAKTLLKNVLKSNSSSRSNNFKKLANLLQEKYHCDVNLQMDEDGKVFGFFFQDSYMKRFFEFFPEVLYIDGTYRLQNIDCCVYVLHNENSFGNMEVVAVAVGDKNSPFWLIEKFKSANPDWAKTEIIVVDKFTSECQLIKEQFPDVCALICQSHAFQLIKKEIKPLKLHLTQSETKGFLTFIEELMYASTEEQYNKIIEEMEEQVRFPLLEYFLKNWHCIRSEWSTAFSKYPRKLINNKLESPNSKLKSMVNSCKNFNEFIEKLFILLEMKRTDFKKELTKTVYKVPKVDKWKNYRQSLTDFAFNKIEPFLRCEKQYFLVQHGTDMICETTKKKLVLSETSCSCFFFTEIRLPCRHVLFYRKSLKMDLFDEDLFSERWTKNYVRVGFDSLLFREESSNKNDQVREVCEGLEKLCAKATGEDFFRKLNLLTKIKQSWEKGLELDVASNTVK